MSEERRVSFHFHPFEDGSPYAVEKEDAGQKRRYLKGISSGLQIDGAGERMTEKCIKSFQDQARSGDVLLYAGKHGVDFTDDIGKLVASEITPAGDWLTEYRLYDEADRMGPGTLEKADKAWRHILGIAPYKIPKKMGFSIEGVIPDGGIQTVDQSGRRVMDAVELDGVLLVPRPAYKESVARAVYKALGLLMPSDMKSEMRKSMPGKLSDAMERDDYYLRYFRLQGALDDEIHLVMKTESPERGDQLRTLFGEYRDLMVDLIMRSESVFKDDSASGGSELVGRASAVHPSRMRRLEAATVLVHKMLKEHGLRTVPKPRPE